MNLKNESERLASLQAYEFKRNPFWTGHVLPSMKRMREDANTKLIAATLAGEDRKAMSYAASIEAIDALLATIEYPIEVFSSLTSEALEETENG